MTLKTFPDEMLQMIYVPKSLCGACRVDSAVHTPKAAEGEMNRGALLQKQLCCLSSCSCSSWRVPGWLVLQADALCCSDAGVMDVPWGNSRLQEVPVDAFAESKLLVLT